MKASYVLSNTSRILTPALLIYPERIQSNIEITVKLLGNDVCRWRPHIKTAKLQYVIKMLVARGIKTLKCATSLELTTAIAAGATDILVAHTPAGANAVRICQVAKSFPRVSISVLVDSPGQIEQWRGSQLGIFIDINPGMNRTGADPANIPALLRLACAVHRARLRVLGLHYYDGHLSSLSMAKRNKTAHAGYRQLLAAAKALQEHVADKIEIVTAGTPSFPCTLTFPAFSDSRFLHRASPGTVVYCDGITMRQLPKSYGYRPAVLVLSRVISHPNRQIFTCDAGHKTIGADSGIPNCAVVDMDHLHPLRPSEEHLPIEFAANSRQPAFGQSLYLIPEHVCPTVNNFDHALIVQNGKVQRVEPVTARGREAPLLREN